MSVNENEEYEIVKEIKNLSFSKELLCDLLSKSISEGKVEFITEEDEQKLFSLDSSDLNDEELTKEFNMLFNTDYSTTIKDEKTNQDNESSPINTIDESITAKAQELIDILCSDDDTETDTLKTMAAAMDFLKVLPDDGLAIKVPVVNYVKSDMEPNKEYVVMDKNIVNKLIEENSEISCIIEKMTSEMGITVKSTLDSQVKAMLKLWFSLKANTKNIDKIILENEEQKSLINSLNDTVANYKDTIKELKDKIDNLTHVLDSLGNVGSLQNPRYVLSFTQPKTNQVVWLTSTKDGSFSPTNFSATLVLFEAFKFGDLDTVRKFLDLLIENVGKHGIPEQYLSNIRVQEIMIKDCK